MKNVAFQSGAKAISLSTLSQYFLHYIDFH